MGIDELGIIIDVFDDRALVRVEKGERCTSCASRSMCVQDEASAERKIVEAINPLDIPVGRKVRLHVRSGDLLKASLLMFALPLFFLLVGALLGEYIAGLYGDSASDLFAALFGIGFMGVAFLGVRLYTNRTRDRNSFYPYITGVAE